MIKSFLVLPCLTLLLLGNVLQAQIPMSPGSYSQNFDSLATSGLSNPWSDNVTLPGWYASRVTGGTVTTYRGDSGASFAGAFYSYGVSGVSNLSDRALGTIASGTPGNLAFGLRFTNDTTSAVTNILISYIGEQWRNGGNTTPHTWTFGYRVSSSAITDADASNTAAWNSVPALDFVSPVASSTASALDGNATANRQAFAYVLVNGTSVLPGQELFIRWFDPNDLGNDHGAGVDDLRVIFNDGTNGLPSQPEIVQHPQSQTVVAGRIVNFEVLAIGNPRPSYQWQFNQTNLPGVTSPILTLSNPGTNDSGSYRVVVTNSLGAATSEVAVLSVLPPVETLTVMTYNTKGFGTTDWSTNAAQVRAIGRQLQHLQPDVVAFQEIPYTNRYQMTNWVTAFLPGYDLATTTTTDGLLCSSILSRFPITRSQSLPVSRDLAPFGFTGADFTRDLFEAEIAVPGFPQPFHVFTTHLKAGQSDPDDLARRAAEASAISNYFVTGFLTTNWLHPYVVTGDMNEDVARPPAGSMQPLQRLTNGGTGLHIITSVSFTNSELTFSVLSPSRRYDYVLPNAFLSTNIVSSQVFRTDLLPGPPPPLLSSDSVTGSDHMPVLVTFTNPYNRPFKIVSATVSNSLLRFEWSAVPGQVFTVQTSSNLLDWADVASEVLATDNSPAFDVNLTEPYRFLRIVRRP